MLAWQPSLLWVLVRPLLGSADSRSADALKRAAVHVLSKSTSPATRHFNLLACERSNPRENAGFAHRFARMGAEEDASLSASEAVLYRTLAERYIKEFKLLNDGVDPQGLVALMHDDEDDVMYFAPVNGEYDGITMAILLRFLVRHLQSHVRGAGRRDDGAWVVDPVELVEQTLSRFPIDDVAGDPHDLRRLDYETVALRVEQRKAGYRPYAAKPLSDFEKFVAKDLQKLEGGHELSVDAGPVGLGCALLVKLMRSARL
jgi:hypothetical protein